MRFITRLFLCPERQVRKFHPIRKPLHIGFITLSILLLAGVAGLFSAACEGDTPAPTTPAPAPPPPPPAPAPEPSVPDSEAAMRWWNVLNADQMVAALYGAEATDAQREAAARMYADLDDETKTKVNDAAAEIYGDGEHDSVGAWWETLDCRLMRVAAGDGNVADPMSPFCAHYPGSGAETILDDDSKAWVDVVGMALLGRDDPGAFPGGG